MLKLIISAGLGGALGTLLRLQFSILFSKYYPTTFPLATFTVNITGCFLVGLFYALSARYDWVSAEWRLFLITGFCGGLTTFSTFAYENIRLLQQGHASLFILYSILSYALGLLAVLAGIGIMKFF